MYGQATVIKSNYHRQGRLPTDANKIQSRCMQMAVKQPYVERFERSNAQEIRDDDAHRDEGRTWGG